jgi:hypothetical protein
MNISEPFIKRPVATALLMAGVIIMGLLGYSLLPISALPAVDFPTIQVTAQFPRREPGRDDFDRHDTARTAVRADQRADDDDLDQLVRNSRDHAAIRARSRHRRGGAGRAGRDQCGGRRAAEDDAESADLLEGQPVDQPILTHRAHFGLAAFGER